MAFVASPLPCVGAQLEQRIVEADGGIHILAVAPVPDYAFSSRGGASGTTPTMQVADGWWAGLGASGNMFNVQVLHTAIDAALMLQKQHRPPALVRGRPDRPYQPISQSRFRTALPLPTLLNPAAKCLCLGAG